MQQTWVCQSCTSQLLRSPAYRRANVASRVLLRSGRSNVPALSTSGSRYSWHGHVRSYATSPSSTASSQDKPFRCAIIGSGPAGFYAAHRMLQKMPEARVDMYEGLPVPYGLVRFGVAPDHPEVKNCIDTFSRVATHPSFTYIGNVTIGTAPSQLPLTSLVPHYNAVLFAYGASRDKKLHIPGEDTLSGIYSARDFVNWYNGLPSHADLAPTLDASDEAVIIGQGNVALDVARILLAPLAHLAPTDISSAAMEVLSKSRVKRVRIVGRRGPLQASYTIKEVRELMQMPDVGFTPIQDGLVPRDLKKLPRQLMRLAQVVEKGSELTGAQAAAAQKRQWELRYMLSPAAFEPAGGKDGELAAVRFDKMEYATELDAVDLADMYAIRGIRVQKREDGAQEVLKTGLAFRSVGYASTPIDGLEDIGVPFDDKMGIIPNDMYGRVMSPSRGPGGLSVGHVPGCYAAGWVKRGPTGVIASTMNDAFTSADVVTKDWADHLPFLGSAGDPKDGWEGVRKEVESKNIRWVSWEEWQRIDAEEKKRGAEKGKEREKCRSVEEMLKIIDA